MRRAGIALVLRAALLLAALVGAPALAWGSGPHASTARTSRWWDLECAGGDRSACIFRVKLHGAIDSSRLHLIRRAIERRDAARRALRREVDLQIDLDSSGGEVFAALEIGRVLREAHASARVRDGASCLSACVFVLMGAVVREIDDASRVAIHRPSLRTPGVAAAGAQEHETVAAMFASLVHYAEQMHFSRQLIDDMMSTPPGMLRLLRHSELVGYGLVGRDPVAPGPRAGESSHRNERFGIETARVRDEEFR